MKNLNLIVCGRIGTNSYLLSDEEKNAVVIDVPDGSGEKLADFCAENGLKPLSILLTHGHFDHCGGVAGFLRKINVPVYASEADAELMNKASQNRFRVPAENCAATEFVADDETLKIGNFEFKVMATPGHTDGSVCYFIDDFMFSGDTLFCDSIGRTDFAESNPQKMKESLAKINKIERNYIVFPGHEESTRLKDEQENNIYLRGECSF